MPEPTNLTGLAAQLAEVKALVADAESDVAEHSQAAAALSLALTGVRNGLGAARLSLDAAIASLDGIDSPPDPVDPGPDPEDDPDPAPIPTTVDLLIATPAATTSVLVAGPTGLPSGEIPRTGEGHQGAPDMSPYYYVRHDVDNAATRGSAPVFGASSDTLRIGLYGEDKVPDGGASGMHMKWFYWTPVMDLTTEQWIVLEGDESAWTWKEGGAGAFRGAEWNDPKWLDFPAGGRITKHTCMIRSCGWKYGDATAETGRRLMEVVKAGKPTYPPSNPSIDVIGNVRVWAGAESGGEGRVYSSSYVDDTTGHDFRNQWVGTRKLLHFGDLDAAGNLVPNSGWFEVWRSRMHEPWQRVMRVEGIQWVQEPGPEGPGWNMFYDSFMLGGDQERFLPHNDRQGHDVLRRDLCVAEGLWRPKVTA